MESGNSPDQSRVDAKIRRDTLLKDGLEDLWDRLWVAVKATCKKVNSHWNSGLVAKLNDGNSVMRVIAPPVSAILQQRERLLEIRLERSEHKIVVRVPHREIADPYPIKADNDGRILTIGGKRPLELTESLVAESLLELTLDS